MMYNRERELMDLKKFYDQCFQKGINCGVLIYGWRRVGKTTLLKEFAKKMDGVYIDCVWISDPYVFAKTIAKFVTKELENEARLLLVEDDPLIMFKTSFELLSKIREKPIIILDEFHVFLEKIATRIAREKKEKKEIVIDDLLGIIKDSIEEKNAFWIIATSLGWVKIKETLIKPRKTATPLISVIKRYPINPFNENESIGFAQWVNKEITDDEAKNIYKLTGGVPRLIEIIASNFRKEQPILSLVTHLIRSGELDDFFENLIKFVAEAAKRDYTLLIQTLKTIGLEEKTTEEVANQLGMSTDTAYMLLEELVKMELVEKNKIGRKSIYKIKYPILPLWLELRITPERDVYNILATQLGITLESYIKELITEYIRRNEEIEIYDDKEGKFLFGTTQKLSFKPIKVLRLSEAIKKYKIRGDFDLLVETADKPLLIEIKLNWSTLKEEDLESLKEASRKINASPLIIVAKGEPRIPLITKAIRKEIIILSGEAIKLLAKKVNFPHW